MSKFTHLIPFNRYFKNRLKSNASKWGDGIGLLWRGNRISFYLDAFHKQFYNTSSNNNINSNSFLFESSRVAIYHYAKYIGLSANDRVQVFGFTCEAVTDAIKPFNAKISLYDCHSDLKAKDFILFEDTKLLICQVTFGVCALSNDMLDYAASKNVKILIDKSLSYGVQDFIKEIDIKYPEVFSFEVSKSFTIGWGGMMNIPKSDEYLFLQYYATLDKVSRIDDIFRVLRVITNLYMVRHGSKIGFVFWLICRSIGLHRLSSKSSLPKYQKKSVMGSLSRSIFINLIDKIPDFLKSANKNHLALSESLERAGFKVISRVNESFSTPRIAFLVDSNHRENLENWFSMNYIEVGYWFNTFPLDISEMGDQELLGCSKLMSSICNLPCHGSLDEFEVKRMCECIQNLKYQIDDK